MFCAATGKTSELVYWITQLHNSAILYQKVIGIQFLLSEVSVSLAQCFLVRNMGDKL